MENALRPYSNDDDFVMAIFTIVTRFGQSALRLYKDFYPLINAQYKNQKLEELPEHQYYLALFAIFIKLQKCRKQQEKITRMKTNLKLIKQDLDTIKNHDIQHLLHCCSRLYARCIQQEEQLNKASSALGRYQHDDMTDLATFIQRNIDVHTLFASYIEKY